MRILIEGMRLAGRYTLTRKLGAGGIAEVWLAGDSQTQSSVALKVLSGEASSDPGARTLLNREWRIGGRLMHANIVRVFEFHDDPDGAFYSLQYVGNTSLSVLTGSRPEECLRPIALIADALRYAHGKGIVHRDIKAANILLDSRGLPYLVDFGVSSLPGEVEVSGGGTEIASSPQQQAGEPAAAADDIYALGVLIHELLTGLPPGASNDSMPGDTGVIPVALKDLLNSMLASDARRRPAAETVAARLSAAGFAPGPAPARFVTGAGAKDEVVESVATEPVLKRSIPAVADLASARHDAAGISPKIIIGGLATALLLFLAIVFVLPQFVAGDSSPVTGAAAPANDSASVIAVDPSVDEVASVPGGSFPAGTTSFGENVTGTAGEDAVRIKAMTDDALGDLLSQLERLRFRAIDRWGGQDYLDAVDVYGEGDRAYLGRNYELAGSRYREASKMLEPFFDRIDRVFDETLAAATAAFEANDHREAVRLFDLATSITPGNREAEAGLLRATNLQAVLSLMNQAADFENDLELSAARLAFEKALELDAKWEPAAAGLVRVNAAIKQLTFEQRMTEGFEALTANDFDSARAAFNAARILDSSSSQPTDGLLQVDQEVRLFDIRRLENEALSYDAAEQWETSVTIYQDILKIDSDLQFANAGLAMASSRSTLHARLAGFIDSPDTLSDPVTMNNATALLLDITRMQPIGPRLLDQKNELSRLLKRAATPLPVRLVSDNMTNVAIFKVGQYGMFSTYDLDLRPGNYVVVGIRSGYRDVRVEFRVAPEIEMQPIVVQCEEQI